VVLAPSDCAAVRSTECIWNGTTSAGRVVKRSTGANWMSHGKLCEATRAYTGIDFGNLSSIDEVASVAETAPLTAVRPTPPPFLGPVGNISEKTMENQGFWRT
jgi:hypothetical protein